MPEAMLACLLDDLARRIRPVLDPKIELRLDVADTCPQGTGVDAGQLEAVMLEMVRRVYAVMPAEGVLELRARRGSAPPREALVAAGAQASHWLVLAVGSPEAGMPDIPLKADPRRTDLAQFARRCNAALSLLPLPRRGIQLVLHLPCAPRPHEHGFAPAGAHLRSSSAVG